MSAEHPRVLLTRPSEAAVETAARLRAMGFEPVLNPLIELSPTGARLPPGPFDGIVFTSQAAVRAYPVDDQSQRTPIHVVGEQTAEAARARGFQNVACGGETVEELAQCLKTQPWTPNSRLLYASGVLVTGDLAALIGPQGPAIVRVPLYASHSLSLEKDTIARLYAREVDWVLVFSPRTADVLSRELKRLETLDWMDGTGLACLSMKCGEPLARFGWRRILHAERPTVQSLLACLSEGTADD